MTRATDNRANATLSGRELALQRRHAMALHGKTGASRAASAGTAAAVGVRTAAAVTPAATGPSGGSVPQSQAAGAGRNASRARRQALSTAGKAALQQARGAQNAGRERPRAAVATAIADQPAKASCGCGCNGTKQSCDVAPTGVSAPAVAETVAASSARGASVPAGRALARARRSALSQDGKAGLKRVAQATRIAGSVPVQDWEAVISKGATGRQVAMQRRRAQSLAGRVDAQQSRPRPAGRVRARMEIPAPPKVEEGHTLSGRTVTGILLDRSTKVTGNEPGSCRAITGTEYIGAEQFDRHCATPPTAVPGKPRPAPMAVSVAADKASRERGITGTLVNGSGKVTGNEPGSNRTITGTDYAVPAQRATVVEKVAVTHTTQGKPVTGTTVGAFGKMTGDEDGACRVITGTEYLSMEAFKRCNVTPPERPRKVSVMSSRGEQPVSGSGVGRSDKVTGDEAGACRTITGSQYSMTDSALCSVSGPSKVARMHTLAGRTVTGTEVGLGRNVTGDEMGACKAVTGTEYLGPDQQAEVCTTAVTVAPVTKVAVDQTWRGQPVTGSYVGRSKKVTGDEHGGCAPISGTPYIGRGQYNRFCEAPAQQAQEALVPDSALVSATAVTGDRPGAGGSVMTGDARGACEIVSGTPYIGVDNAAGQCPTSGRFMPRTATVVEPPRPPAPKDFSIKTPARAAQEKVYGGVTGTGYNSDRITGPVNKAGGLITGTPEFRHHDTLATVAEEEAAATAAQRRLTGEGSQAGRPVTGDAWSALSRVTGTEGPSSQGRNPSERGNPRGMGMNARRFREEVEPNPAPPSRITGSAGNTGGGALVTLSGGARG